MGVQGSAKALPCSMGASKGESEVAPLVMGVSGEQERTPDW